MTFLTTGLLSAQPVREVIDLIHSSGAYFEHTLLPREMLHVVGGGTILTLPRNFSDPLKRTGVNYITRLFLDRPALVDQGGPYQASMNAMRLELGQIFGEDKVSLEHSRATMALYRLWVENDDNAGNAAQRAKWARQLTRLNHLPVRILTPINCLRPLSN